MSDFVSSPLDRLEVRLRVSNSLALRRELRAVRERTAKLEELQRFRDEMLTLVVHDLKSPTSVVLANAELAAMLLADAEPNEALAEAIEDIRTAGRRMTRLLANLLDVARAEDKRLVVRAATVEVGALVVELVRVRHAALAAREVQLEMVLDDAVASVDADLVSRLVENVLDNALRFTPVRGTLRVTVRPIEGGVEIRIANSGPPIPLEARRAIFEKYTQLSGSSARVYNSGLGLYFCGLVARAHHGECRVEEEARFPTVFVTTLSSIGASVEG